jgi:hypothetical protein
MTLGQHSAAGPAAPRQPCDAITPPGSGDRYVGYVEGLKRSQPFKCGFSFFHRSLFHTRVRTPPSRPRIAAIFPSREVGSPGREADTGDLSLRVPWDERTSRPPRPPHTAAHRRAPRAPPRTAHTAAHRAHRRAPRTAHRRAPPQPPRTARTASTTAHRTPPHRRPRPRRTATRRNAGCLRRPQSMREPNGMGDATGRSATPRGS